MEKLFRKKRCTMLISDRSKEIIENLMNANEPLTISDLAKTLNVTERTIYRQIPEVTEIIESYDLTLDNTSGKGFMIFGSLYNIKRLSIAFEEVKNEQSYSSKERVDIIILFLLNEDDYIKTQSLAIDLNTSSQTIRNDYHSLKKKLQGHNVVFETKKSEGVRLNGHEIPKRHLFVNVLLQNIAPDSFFDWLKHDNYRYHPFIDLLKKFDYEQILKIFYQKIQPVIRKRHLNISDKELQEFLLLIAIFIKRHTNIDDREDILKLTIQESTTDYEEHFRQDIMKILKNNFDISIYNNEQDYFCWMIHLYVGRSHFELNHQISAFQNLDHISCLISEVEKKFHFPFDEDKNLAENLLLHINMAMERIQSGITVTNPMLEDIYQSNPKLYEIVKESFQKIFHPTKIPEDEIGYIVIYFIASLDYLSKNSISVLVVCSTGIGSSKMLRSRLEREFSEIDVKKIISLHKLHDENLKQYDLIISTVPLDLDENKFLCVSPLLNEDEKHKVKEQIEILNKQRRLS